MLNACKVVGCKHQKPRRFILCGGCWDKLPKELRLAVNDGSEKGSRSLRANPSKSWFEKAIGFVGMIKIPYVMGSGYNAVKVGNSKREVVTAK